jgi:hypothetical protein
VVRISSGVAVAVAVAGALALVGCAPHVVVPQQNTGSEDQTGEADTTTAGAAASGLSSVNPCSLMPPSEAAQLHLAQQTGEHVDQNGMRDCDWGYTGSGGAGVVIGVGINDHNSLNDIQFASDNQVEHTTIGGRAAVQDADEAAGRCAVMVAYSSSSYVEAVMQSDPSQHPCEGAVGVAKVVAGNLPDSG